MLTLTTRGKGLDTYRKAQKTIHSSRKMREKDAYEKKDLRHDDRGSFQADRVAEPPSSRPYPSFRYVNPSSGQYHSYGFLPHRAVLRQAIRRKTKNKRPAQRREKEKIKRERDTCPRLERDSSNTAILYARARHASFLKPPPPFVCTIRRDH